MSKAKQIEHIQILEEQIRRSKAERLKRIYLSLYDWQEKFIASTKNHTASMLMCANQVGKTRTGLTVDATVLLGDYPDDWGGIKFDFAPTCWLLGQTMEKTRDLLQTPLFGRLIDSKLEGGLIPADRIVDHRSVQGTAQAMREVRVLNSTGGISICQFWSYSQGQKVLMGDIVDWFHIDEEPKDPEIFPQVLTRTLNGNKKNGGAGILTFTPENGKTELVCKFMGEDSEDEDSDITLDSNAMCMHTATWDMAPHLSEDVKRKILSLYPAYQRKMRSKGVPLMGTGLIYTIDEDSIKFKPFDYPDYWFVIGAHDFGWDHPSSVVQLLWDREADTFYLINAWKGRHKHPYQIWHNTKNWMQNVPAAWPADGLQHKQQSNGESKQLKAIYQDEGFNMLPDHATWEDGGNGVWVGITQILNLMQEGRFKVASPLFEVFEELRQYHTKTTAAGNTEIVKIKDDLLDACRYAYMMRRHAIRIMDLYPQDQRQQVRGNSGRDKTSGY